MNELGVSSDNTGITIYGKTRRGFEDLPVWA